MMVLKIASAASPRRGIHLFPRKRLWDPRWVLGDMHLCGGEQPLPASSPTHAAHICGLVRCPVGCKVRAFEAPLLCEWVDHVPTSLPSLSASQISHRPELSPSWRACRGPSWPRSSTKSSRGSSRASPRPRRAKWRGGHCVAGAAGCATDRWLVFEEGCQHSEDGTLHHL